MDEVEDDVECACENDGKEETEACQVGISLRTGQSSAHSLD
jgi:hypothetical protein